LFNYTRKIYISKKFRHLLEIFFLTYFDIWKWYPIFLTQLSRKTHSHSENFVKIDRIVSLYIIIFWQIRLYSIGILTLNLKFIRWIWIVSIFCWIWISRILIWLMIDSCLNYSRHVSIIIDWIFRSTYILFSFLKCYQ
jgi:hypothetical protein